MGQGGAGGGRTGQHGPPPDALQEGRASVSITCGCCAPRAVPPRMKATLELTWRQPAESSSPREVRVGTCPLSGFGFAESAPLSLGTPASTRPWPVSGGTYRCFHSLFPSLPALKPQSVFCLH